MDFKCSLVGCVLLCPPDGVFEVLIMTWHALVKTHSFFLYQSSQIGQQGKKRFFLSYEKRIGKIFSILKYEKFHLQIFITIVHINNLFLVVNQPRTYFSSNLCKILDIFLTEIFHISKSKKFCHFVFHMIEKPLHVDFDWKCFLENLLLMYY